MLTSTNSFVMHVIRRSDILVRLERRGNLNDGQLDLMKRLIADCSDVARDLSICAMCKMRCAISKPHMRNLQISNSTPTLTPTLLHRN